MRLCQYVKADVVEKALKADGFWVKASHPCDFNDPFECTGGMYGNPTCSLIEAFYERRPDQVSIAALHGNRDEYVSTWLRNAFRNRRFLGQGYRISCFSDVDRMRVYPGADIHMWAHYANHWMGLRLEFDSEDVDFTTDAVRYVDAAPRLDMSTINHLDDLATFIETCVVTKHKIWEPEQEVRIVFKGPNDAVLFDPAVNMHRWLLPLKCIKRIAIGEALLKASSDSPIMQHIRTIGHGAPYGIPVVAAIRNYNYYGIDYRDVTL